MAWSKRLRISRLLAAAAAAAAAAVASAAAAVALPFRRFSPSILRYLYSRILKGLAVIERTVARNHRPPLFNGKVARHVRSLVLNGDVRLGY